MLKEIINKEIVGYKLIKSEYEEAAKIIANEYTNDWWNLNAYRNLKNYGWMFKKGDIDLSLKNVYRKAGVLDLWFEPVYKTSIPDITINGYKADISDWGVKFGCQSYSKEFIITLSECLEVNNFKMDHKNSIKEIVEYYINKDKND